MRNLVAGVLLCSVCLGMLFGCKKSPALIDVESIVAYRHPVTEGWSNECFIDENGRVRGLDTLPISLEQILEYRERRALSVSYFSNSAKYVGIIPGVDYHWEENHTEPDPNVIQTWGMVNGTLILWEDHTATYAYQWWDVSDQFRETYKFDPPEQEDQLKISDLDQWGPSVQETLDKFAGRIAYIFGDGFATTEGEIYYWNFSYSNRQTVIKCEVADILPEKSDGVAVVRKDGTVWIQQLFGEDGPKVAPISAEGWTGIQQVQRNGTLCVGLRSDGTLVLYDIAKGEAADPALQNPLAVTGERKVACLIPNSQYLLTTDGYLTKTLGGEDDIEKRLVLREDGSSEVFYPSLYPVKDHAGNLSHFTVYSLSPEAQSLFRPNDQDIPKMVTKDGRIWQIVFRETKENFGVVPSYEWVEIQQFQ